MYTGTRNDENARNTQKTTNIEVIIRTNQYPTSQAEKEPPYHKEIRARQTWYKSRDPTSQPSSSTVLRTVPLYRQTDRPTTLSSHKQEHSPIFDRQQPRLLAVRAVFAHLNVPPSSASNGGRRTSLSKSVEPYTILPHSCLKKKRKKKKSVRSRHDATYKNP